jgi:transposase
MGRVEIFQGRARRRWSENDKRRLVAATFWPGETVHGVARRRGLSASQLFTWRKRFRAEIGFPAPVPTVPGFAAVTLAPPLVPTVADAATGAVPGLIEIELAGGGRVRISGAADPAVVMAALQALEGR